MEAPNLNLKKLSLESLQSKMKRDPEGYESTLPLLYNQFNTMVDIFNTRNGITFSFADTDRTLALNLADKAMFLAHLTPFYPHRLSDFPFKLIHLLRNASATLPSRLRCKLASALALLVNRNVLDVKKTLSLFMELQTLGDKTLKKFAFRHLICTIARINKQHSNAAKNSELQNVLFRMLHKSAEKLAKRALLTLCELHRRKVWFDEITANAICTASLHSSSRIKKAALSFLLDYEKVEKDDDSDDSSSDDELKATSQVILSSATVYKANHQGTTASKRKKKAKLQRVIRSMKKQQHLSGRGNSCYYSPLNHLKDAQGFAEELFQCLEKCNEPFQVRMMMLQVIGQTVGLHQLILIKFYPFIQKYIQPHQLDITNLLATAVKACHDKVPPCAVEPLFKHIVNQFVNEGSRPEAITIGLSAVREICVRMPLLMNKDLLQDLALYKKSHRKGVSAAARSLIVLFREVCPSLLVKKDRGRYIDPQARPKAYGEVNVETAVPGAELLHIIDNNDELGSCDSDDSVSGVSDYDHENDDQMVTDSDNDENRVCIGDTEGVDGDTENNDVISEDGNEKSFDYENGVRDADADVEDMENDNEEDDEVSDYEEDDVGTRGSLKRKVSEINCQFIYTDSSLRALKKLAGTTMGIDIPECKDGFLSNGDFQKIKELKAKREARKVLARPRLEVYVKKKLSKDEKLALVRAGREERGQYHARTAVKQKKVGGLSNRQKEKKKKMPMAAKRNKMAARQYSMKKKKKHQGKQFRGRKAWK